METAYFRNIRKESLNCLKVANSNIRVAVAWFTNVELFSSLMEKLKAGVNVELIIIDDYINNGDFGLNFQEFINRGGKLYYGKAENPMHHKFCVIDNSILFTGSYNWTYYAENKNVENIVMFEANAYIINKYIEEFELLKEGLELVTVANRLSFEEI